MIVAVRIVGAVSGIALAIVACGGTIATQGGDAGSGPGEPPASNPRDASAAISLCSQKGPCPSDPFPNPADTAQCEAQLADPICGPGIAALADCILAHPTCDASGKSSVPPACQAQFATVLQCLVAETDAGIGGGG